MPRPDQTAKKVIWYTTLILSQTIRPLKEDLKKISGHRTGVHPRRRKPGRGKVPTDAGRVQADIHRNWCTMAQYSELPENPMRVLISFISAAAVIVSAGPGFAAPAGRLAPKDIETTFFNGQPFTASTLSNVKFKMVFSPDGTMTREPV